VAPIRVGVIGVGSVAEKYIPMVQRMNIPRQRTDVTVVSDINEKQREVALRRYGIENFATNPQEVIDSSDVDVVLILTSMQAHYELAKSALKAGKHVLVEKPMAMTVEQGKELVALAKESPGYFVCAPHVVLSSTYQNMWRRIHNGDIGRVYSARGFYGWSGPWWGPFFYEPGGGSMFDLGVYNVTTLTGLLGPAKRVMAMSGVAIPGRVVDGEMMKVESDDNAHLLLDFGNTTYAVVTTGFTIQRYKVPGIEIYGSEGTIQMIGEDWAPRGYELWQNSAGCWQTFEDYVWPWPDGVRHLIESIETNTRPVITPEHALHTLEIMLGSMESGKTGRSIDLTTTFEPPRFDFSEDETPAHLKHDPGRDE
jgi:predicted dehydrogenase